MHSQKPGDGTIYIVSGFANYNGGARFYKTFSEHTERNGRIVAFLGGSSQQNLSSKQVAEALLECGAEVNIVNRKRLLHAKCYGTHSSAGQSLIVTSGNFTAPGMSQNVEAALLLEAKETASLEFSWHDLEVSMRSQNWQIFQPNLDEPDDPRWSLLYDESVGSVQLDKSDEVTLLITLGHNDTKRIQAQPKTDEAKGTQYFFLSKDIFDFFPPLTLRNNRGYKSTLSALVTMHYIDLGETVQDCRVTFEAGNNLDFRLGTGPLRYTKLASTEDIACVTRIGDAEYELRIAKLDSALHDVMSSYAIDFVGNRGKRYGFLANDKFLQTVAGER